MKIYKKPYKDEFKDLLRKKKSKIFFSHLSEGVVCDFNKNDLISIVTFIKLNFPYDNLYEFHVEMFTKNKFNGLTSILKSLKKLEDDFGADKLLSRHTKHEFNTLIMLNDLDYYPFEFSNEGEKNILVRKIRNKSLLDFICNTKLNNFKKFISGWLAKKIEFDSIEEFYSKYNSLLEKNRITTIQLSKNSLMMLDKNQNESVIFNSHKLSRKDLILIFNTINLIRLKNIYVATSQIGLDEAFFLSGYRNSKFEYENFTKWNLDI